jgi:hypothetical protein
MFFKDSRLASGMSVSTRLHPITALFSVLSLLWLKVFCSIAGSSDAPFPTLQFAIRLSLQGVTESILSIGERIV